MKHTRNKIIQLLDGDTSQEHILQVCRNNGLVQKYAEAVDIFLNKTMEQVAEELDIDVRTVQRRVNRFIETLGNKLS